MNFISYCKATITTTKSCLKISGIIFTTIATLLVAIIPPVFSHESILEPTRIFIICFVYGNTLGILIIIIAIIDGFVKQRRTVQFYHTLPKDIKDKYALKLVLFPQNFKYSYLKINIKSSIQNSLYLIFERLKNQDINSQNIVKITLCCYPFINADYDAFRKLRNDEFYSLSKHIASKYEGSNITLTKQGMCRTIKWKDWKKLTVDDIERSIQELIFIARNENMELFNNNNFLDV